MGAVTHICCPGCKGALGITNVDRILTCAYCEARLMVDHPGYMPQYAVTASVDETRARRMLQKYLTSKFLPKGLLKRARFISATLCYVPFYEFRARRLGTIQTSVNILTNSPVNAQKINTNKENAGQYGRRNTVERSTDTVMGDVRRIEPSIHLDRLGVEYCDVASTIDGSARLRPAHEVRQRKEVRWYPPVLPAEDIESRLKTGGLAASVQDDTEYVEKRTKVIFYPVWRIKYRVSNRLFSASVDGVTGKLLTVTAPEGNQMRVLSLLAGALFLGALGGLAIRLTTAAEFRTNLELASQTSLGGAFFLVALVIFVGLGALWMMVWNQFRWPGEVVKIGDEIQVEKYNGLLQRRIRLPLLTPLGVVKAILGKR